MIGTEDDYSVIPINDIHPHIEQGGSCPCRPRVIFESGKFIWVHNSYDSREHKEDGHNKKICEICKSKLKQIEA